MTVATMWAVEAAAPVCRGAAKFATALIAQMLVVLVRAVQTAGTEGCGVTKAASAHWMFIRCEAVGGARFA